MPRGVSIQKEGIDRLQHQITDFFMEMFPKSFRSG